MMRDVTTSAPPGPLVGLTAGRLAARRVDRRRWLTLTNADGGIVAALRTGKRIERGESRPMQTASGSWRLAFDRNSRPTSTLVIDVSDGHQVATVHRPRRHARTITLNDGQSLTWTLRGGWVLPSRAQLDDLYDDNAPWLGLGFALFHANVHDGLVSHPDGSLLLVLAAHYTYSDLMSRRRASSSGVISQS
jgi:hypothetical protein